MTRKSDESQNAIGRWEVQLRKGVLEFVILLSLSDHEQYGFELISGIAKRAAIDVPEGTLYPLMLRLAKDGLISSRLADGDGGTPQILCPDSPGQGFARHDPVMVEACASVDSLPPGASA
jgi:PadR family transcriptional regulator PadR